ncbi:MAG: MFS transporter [Acidimicrobiia bacterium]
MVPTTYTVFIATFTVGLACLLVAGLSYAAAAHRQTGEPSLRATVTIGAAIVFGWLVAIVLLAREGAFASSPDRRVPGVLFGIGLPVALGWVLLARWSAARRLVERVPLPWLMGVQLYRVVGAVFLFAFAQDLIPGEFALPAGLGDVAIGLAAPVVAYALLRRGERARRAAVTWNVLGIADLVVAVSMGFLTSPSPLQQLALDAPNVLTSRYPFALIPEFAVPVSILLHLLSLRRLRQEQHKVSVGRAAGTRPGVVSYGE